MKLQEFRKLTENVNPCAEILGVYDIEVTTDNEIKIKLSDALQTYYDHIENMKELRRMIRVLKDDGVEVMEEMEAVNIAHVLDLDFQTVKAELEKNNIKVEVI